MAIHSDFFPTDPETSKKLVKGLHLLNMKVHEPQAGKGDLVDYLKSQGAYVTACEVDRELALVAASKVDEFLKFDFFDLTERDLVGTDYIVMNPPFSNAEKHIRHAYDIAPEGCVIRFIMNAKTYLKKDVSRGRTVLYNLIQEKGKILTQGRFFIHAERSSHVECMIGELIKPIVQKKESEWDIYFEDEDSDQEGSDGNSQGMMEYSVLRSIVNRVVASFKLYDQVMDNAVQMNGLIGEFLPPKRNGREEDLTFTMTMEGIPQAREKFVKEIQRGAWLKLFKEMNLNRLLTKVVQGKIDKFIETQQHVKFTMHNIRQVFEMIVGTSSQLMDESYEDVFNRLTSYSDNQMTMEGWKTNSHFMINEKIILPSVVREDGTCGWGDGGNRETMDDLYKIICHMTGERYNENKTTWNFFNNRYRSEDEIRVDPEFIERTQKYFNELKAKGEVTIKFNTFFESMLGRECNNSRQKVVAPRNTWVDWTFFELKWFKKGTVHLRWKDEDTWRRFNKRICEIRGLILPENF